MYVLIKDISSEVTGSLFEGGLGSGGWGHRGRPGHRGGSLPGGNAAAHVAMTPGGVHKKVTSGAMAKYLVPKIAQGKYNTWGAAIAKMKAKFPGQPESRYERAAFKAGLRSWGGSLQIPTVRAAVKLPNVGVVPDASGGLAIPLTTGKVAKMVPLNGGLMDSYKIDIEGDGSAVLKPSKGERNARKYIPKGTYYKREAATYEVAKVVGMNDLVPETYVRADDKKGMSAVVAWIPNAQDACLLGESKKYGQSVEDFKRASLFDYVIGAQDRHDKNWMVDDYGGKIHLIDNGLNFATKGGYLRSQFINEASKRSYTIPTQLYEKFVEKRAEIESALRKHGIEEDAITNMGSRYGVLARVMSDAGKPHTFTSLKDDHQQINGWTG